MKVTRQLLMIRSSEWRGGQVTESPGDRSFSSHPHFSSLAAKSSHTLLAPLGTHTSHHRKSNDHGILLVKTSREVSRERGGAAGEGEELSRDELNVRDPHLEFIGSDVGVHIQGEDLVVDRANKDLHPRERETEEEASPWLLKSRGRADSKGREPASGSPFDGLKIVRREENVR